MRVMDEQTGKMVDYVPGSREYTTSSTGETPAFKQFIDDGAYGEAQSRLVVKTCDVLVYDPATARVLVASRQHNPHPGDWIAGGAQQAGVFEEPSVLNSIRHELGRRVADFARGRLIRIQPPEPYNVIWDSREQQAGTNEAGEPVTGVHHSPTVFALPADETGFNAIVEPNEEYSRLHWEDAFDVIDSPDGRYHPAFRDMVFDLFDQVTRPD